MREAITSRHNPVLAHFKRLLTVRAYRAEHREFAADGVKLLAEAVRWGCPLTAVLVQLTGTLTTITVQQTLYGKQKDGQTS